MALVSGVNTLTMRTPKSVRMTVLATRISLTPVRKGVNQTSQIRKVSIQRAVKIIIHGHVDDSHLYLICIVNF